MTNTYWQAHYADRVGRMRSSMIRDLLKLTQAPDIISFAGGLPAPEFFPQEAISEASARVLKLQGEQALQYGTTEGYLPLREMIVRHMGRYGITCTTDNVLITTGSQQALDLIGKVFINSGDRIIVESPTYLGALQAWSAYGAEYESIPIDDYGIVTDEVEAALQRQRVKFIYAMPNFQNPSGIAMSLKRRQELIEIAQYFQVPIIEDDPYGQLRYEGEHLPPLLVLDDEHAHLPGVDQDLSVSNVLYLSTFSKTLCPGLRVAWIVGPEEVIKRMVQAKQGADLHTSTFAQMVAYETAREGFLDKHIRTLRKVYRERRDHMLAMMDAHFPTEVSWTRPHGGMFLWVRLPEDVDASDVLRDALRHKVAFVPGEAFHTSAQGRNTIRLNFSYSTLDQIETGIQRLGMVLHTTVGTTYVGAP